MRLPDSSSLGYFRPPAPEAPAAPANLRNLALLAVFWLLVGGLLLMGGVQLVQLML